MSRRCRVDDNSSNTLREACSGGEWVPVLEVWRLRPAFTLLFLAAYAVTAQSQTTHNPYLQP